MHRAACALIFGFLAATAPAAPPVGAGLSTALPADALAGLLAKSEGQPVVRVRVSPGDEGALASFLAAASGHARVIVALDPAPQERPADVDGLAAWAARVGAAAAGRVAAFEVTDSATCLGETSAQAFALKRAILALRTADPSAAVAAATGRAPEQGCPEGAALPADEKEALWPFLDALAEAGDRPSALSRSLLEGPPLALPRWHHSGANVAAGGEWEALLEARLGPHALATIPVSEPGPGLMRALAALARAIPDEAERLPDGSVTLTWPEGVSLPSAALIVGSDLSQRVVFGPAPQALRARATFAIARLPARVAGARIVDPEGSAEGPVNVASEAGGITALKLPLVPRPLVLELGRAGSADEVQGETRIDAVREPSLEEILARHAQRAAQRTAAVRWWSADLATTMRYELGASGRFIEIRIDSRYHERDGVREIENLRWFIDGAPYEPKAGKMPELPLIQPEKVTVVPLEVRLDKSYEYELRGRETREGRPAWHVAFRPVGSTSAWTGAAWIDAVTYDLIATDVAQTGLAAPVLSNQQREVRGNAGEDGAAWLVRAVDVRRVLSIVGANVVVDIAMRFSGHVVNDPGFDAALEAAHASERQMLRETDEGLRYLRRDESGQRVLAEPATRKVFFVAGARVDDSFEWGVIPLAGLNLLETDAWGKGLQVNAFLAGAINSLSISDPSLAGGKTSLSFDAFLPLVQQVDRRLSPESLGGLDDDTAASVREPSVGLTFGRPFGARVQLQVETRLAHQSWSEAEDTVGAFAVPGSTWVASLGADLQASVKDWEGRIGVERSARSSWEPWGARDALGEPTVSSPGSWWTWRLQLSRDLSLTSRQSLRIEAEHVGGDDLDRFSQYEFSAFGGPQMPGFEGTGIHFDQASILRLQWRLAALGPMGIEATVAAAHVRDELAPAAEAAWIGREGTHAGLRLAATFPGPWRTVGRVEAGLPVSSADHPELVGDPTGQVLFTKLLK